jgi:hypothetical protein
MGMPWAWRCGPSTASERDHLLELLEQQKFPGNTLFCGDAGFVGYRLWKAILDGGQNFLIRVGANVRPSCVGPSCMPRRLNCQAAAHRKSYV